MEIIDMNVNTRSKVEFRVFELFEPRPGVRPATLISVPASGIEALKDRDIVFTPTIDMIDQDSTRKGPTNDFLRRGYQRPPEAQRIRKIAQYYSRTDLLGFTTPLIAAVRRGLDHKALADVIERGLDGNLEFHNELAWALAVIDGQHRLEGAISALGQDPPKDANILILCVHDLDYEQETDVFNVINTTPKRLPKALTEWNKYGITESGARDQNQLIRELVVNLAIDEDSVWEGMINLTGTGREPGKPVTLEGIRRSTENMFRSGTLRYTDAETQLKMAKDFWRAVSETFPEAWEDKQRRVQLDDGTFAMTGDKATIDGKSRKIPAVQYRLKDLVGVASLAKIGGEILAEAQGNSDPDAYVREEVEKLSDVNWIKTPENKWAGGQAGFAGQKGMYEALAFLRAHGVAPWDVDDEG
jgi:DGQHR domain-containing protein